jgi:branched-chain amino acid aminotransferase
MIQWQGGEWVETTVIEANHEVVTGQGVFETLLVSDQVPQFFKLHWERLNNSCERLGVRAPAFSVIWAGFDQLLDGRVCERGRLRITLFGGVPQQLLIMSLVDVEPWPRSASVIISPWTRNANSAITGVKSVSYAENALALKWAKDLGFGETLLFNSAGHLAEAATSNILVVLDGEVVTPPLHSGCLPGITRGLISEFRVREADIDASGLDRATAAALLSSTRGVQPIDAIGERELDVTDACLRQVMDSYRAQVEQDKKNWARTPKGSRPA